MRTLDIEFDNLRQSGEYSYAVEISSGGREHVFKTNNPPTDGRYWGAQIGAVAHALPSSLEHLAWQLVIANGGTPTDRTELPMLDNRPKRALFVNGSVPSKALTIIEAAQPYNGTDDGRKLAAIHAFDIFDKHRELMVTVATVHQASTHGPAPLPQNSINFSGLPIGNEVAVAIVNYDEPQLERDPNLVITPYLAFGDGTPYPHEVVEGLMWQLITFVHDEFVPRFQEWVLQTQRGVNVPLGFARGA